MEQWKDIPGYEGLYQASTLGRIKSLKFGKERIMKLHLCSNGYYQTGLSKDSVVKMFTVHFLIATTFLNHKKQGLKDTIDHINGDRKQNTLNNLRIISHRENSAGQRKKSSKYIGVCLYKPRNKWLSRIKIQGKYKFLGYFDDEEEAAQAYQNALKSLNQIY